MLLSCMESLLAVTLALAAGAEHHTLEVSPNLIRNHGFTKAIDEGLPTDWTVWNPVWQPASCSFRCTEGGLLVEAPESPFAVGGVRQDIPGIKPGNAYEIGVSCVPKNVPSPFRSIYVRWTWTRNGKPLHPAGALVRGPLAPPEGDVDRQSLRVRGVLRFEDVLIAPEEADGAQLSLEVKWPRGGSVLWPMAHVFSATPPPPRKVKIGTVFLRPRGSTPEKNLELFCEQIDAAGKLKLDILCLGEAITMVGTSKTVNDVAEPIPGPSTERLGKAARQNKLWVVAGLTERDGKRIYNTAVLLDRQGKLAGKYRKVHLPREEWKKGITPGSEYPVFQTDFGTVAIQICYDWFFPESHTIFALHGAEIIFAPTWGNTLPDDDGMARGETVFRVRARDNGVYLVPSVYDGSSMVIDPLGRILASNKGRDGVFWAEVDLNRRERLRWVGHWGSIGPRHRMPETYGAMLGDAP
ncbi:MAG: carbon-nitrogen hydrolase family protein [Candidatus Nealsonbacteria bacterium]|nr:carbon-nitrogen hydrolase family protein [Candidatus Nealsonbacteria bacterium]